jgi:rubrerythrin
MDTETGGITGTPDKDYNILWFTQTCLSNALRLEVYANDAERAGDTELAEFFRKAQSDSKKGAQQGKELLAKRLNAS